MLPLFSFPLFLLLCFFVFFGFSKTASAFLFSAFLFLVLLQERSPLGIHSIPAPYVFTRLGTVWALLGNSCEVSNCPVDRGILCVPMQCDYRACGTIRALNSRGMRFPAFLRYRFLEIDTYPELPKRHLPHIHFKGVLFLSNRVLPSEIAK